MIQHTPPDKKYPMLLVLALNGWPDTSPETVRELIPSAIYGWVDLDTDQPYKSWYVIIETPEDYAATFGRVRVGDTKWDGRSRQHTFPLDNVEDKHL